ncbi:MAG: CBS domain-containing protein [Methanomicrobiales archaeon]|jgi:CBS domain-containing protein|nr:CBS domain-containing protein [Methanomicrobiales archaeon]MDD1647337.1 CBS domain-containing protein [Methanomicrobiales archaeon]
MHRENRITKGGDRLLKMPGKLDRGPVSFESRIAEREGEVMAIATRTVVSIPPTSSIMGAIEKMTGCGFRRLPVTDAGTRQLRGIVTAGDIIDLMGGGSRYNLVQKKHAGNLLAAINESVREIMTTQVVTVSGDARIQAVADLIVGKKVGGLPIVNGEGILEGIVTERDVMKVLTSEKRSTTVEEVMSTALTVTSPESPIGAATRQMIGNRFRRLPVVKDDVLFGIITATDVMKYLGTGAVFEKLVTGNVAEVMALPVRTLVSGDLSTISPDRSLNEAAREMLQKNVGSLPVIEDARLVGLITEFDLVKAFSRR